MSTKAFSGTALVPAVPPPPAGTTRVAVIQLAYHPAALREDKASSPLEDPLFSFKRGDTLVQSAGWSAPDPLREELKALRHRIRSVYCDQLRRRLVAVLEACAAMGVQIAVLPEYSVPFDLLEAIAAAAPGMVVVGGTHSVERAALKKNTAAAAPQDAPALDVYQRLGAPVAPRLLESVCPVLYGGKLAALQPKLNPALPERDFMRRGERWHPVSLPEPLHGSMGVLICLDFLYRESTAYREHVAVQLDGCSFIAVPSLTPHYSLPEFSGQATMEARRRGKPVLYCNTAEEGGTSIYIDEKESARPFPEGPGALGREDEGVIIADLRLDLVPRGKSTRHDEPRLLTPVAAASLVYRAQPREREYAAWVEELHRKANADDELDALEAITAHVHEAEALLRDVGQGGMRRGRLTRLQEEIDRAADVDRAQQLAREVLLPPDVLPLQAVRAAMALGAADVVRWWRERSGLEAAELADVERRLRGESGAAAWSGEQALLAEGRRAFEEIVRVVRGEAPAHREREVLVAQVQAYAGAAMEGFEAEQREAQAAFDAGRFEEARTLFQKMLVTAEGLVEKDPDEMEPRRWVARCQLNVAACSLNLQEVESAAEVLRRIDAAYLQARGRLRLAEALAYTGDLAGARATLPDQADVAAEDQDRLAEVRQILELREGMLPTAIGSGSAVQLQAAEVLLERDDLDGAAEHALRALDSAQTSNQLVKASAVSVLIASLKRTVHEEPPSSSMRPIAMERREAVVRRIDQTLLELQPEELPPAVRCLVRRWQVAYYGLVFDVARLQPPVASPEGESNSAAAETSAPRAGARALAGRLATEGKLEEALAALPEVDHPWLGRWQRAELAAIAGRTDRALADALELAQEVPDKAPIEYQAAALLCQERRGAEALPYARRAFQALPGKGQRILLAQCLIEADHAAEAWTVLEPLREIREAKVKRLLAQAAELAEPRLAPDLWAAYLELRPADSAARIRQAQALYKIGRREEGADVAWAALRSHGEELGPDAIFTAATLQVLQGEEPREHIQERLEQAAALLRRRFPSDPRAELLRSQLLMLLPGTVDVEPVDWALLESAGLVQVVPLAEALERFQQGEARATAALELYRMGALPFASLCDLSGVEAPRMVMQLVRRSQQGEPAVCAPSSAEVAAPLGSIEGLELLVSDLELYLLDILDLLPRLHDALGNRGRIVMLADTERRLIRDESNLRAMAASHNDKPDGLASEGEAVRLADRVARFVARGRREGWITVVDPPTTVPELPPLREGAVPGEAASREPLRALLTVRTVQQEHPALWRVTADSFGRNLLGLPLQIQSIAWPTPERYLSLSRWNREAAARDLHLTVLLRLLPRQCRTDDKLLRLAELNFPDALGAGELIRLERRHRGLGKEEPRRILDRMEWLAAATEHVGAELARQHLAQVYAETVWAAFCGGGPDEALQHPVVVSADLPEATIEKPALDMADARALAEELLRRVEHIDKATRAMMTDLVLLFIAAISAYRPLAFGVLREDRYVFNQESRGKALWSFLYGDWGHGNPARRAALGRAMRGALCILDRAHPEGVPLQYVAGLLPTMQGGHGMIAGSPLISMEEPEIEALTILSTFWKEHPLALLRSRSVGGNEATLEITLADVVACAGRALEETRNVQADSRTAHFDVAVHDLQQTMHLEIPVEAVLLRAPEHMRRSFAEQLIEIQGKHDGRAVPLLSEIAKHPGDPVCCQEFARFSVLTLWRLVRDDPGFLLRWPLWRGGDRMRSAGLEDLRAILSEPEGSLTAKQPISQLLDMRIQDGGIWIERPDVHALYFQASEVPGSLPAVTLSSKLADEVYPHEVEGALHRLDHPHEHPIARLAGDLYFLSVAAANKPQVQLSAGPVDLNHELPDRVLRLLNQTIAAPPQDTLAEAEGALLRVCQLVVARLQRTEPLPPRDHLWLTYRLFQWLCAQLAAISPDARREGMRRLVQEAPAPAEEVQDLLDPSHFDRSLFDHRLAALLYALAAMGDLVSSTPTQGEGPEESRSVISSEALEHKLAELSALPRRGHRATSELEWNAPAEIPDLALIALLRRDPKGLLSLTPEARLRWLEVLPDAPESLEKGELELVRLIVISAADNAAAFDPTERATYEEKLHHMNDSPIGRKFRWIGLSSLFSPMAPHLEEYARALLVAHLGDPLVPRLCGRFLSALAAIDRLRLEQEVDVLLARASTHSEAASIMILVGLARVALAGPAEARASARGLLRRLVAQPQFRDDPDLSHILRALNIPEPTS